MRILMLALPLSLIGLEVAAQNEEEIEAPVDEIIVQGEMTTARIRYEIRVAEQQIFDLFNEINELDEYDVICKRRARIGSQIVRTECKARMYWEELSERSEDLAEQSEYIGTSDGGRVVADPQAHAARLRELIAQAAVENPALLEALRKRRDLRARLAEANAR